MRFTERNEPTWDGRAWTCVVQLSHWADVIEDPAGRVRVVFLAHEDPSDEPAEQQLAELERLCSSDDQRRKSVERDLRRYYIEMHPRYLDFLDASDEQMPNPLGSSDFSRIHTLQCVFVHAPESNQAPCIGFSFAALWEVEHGLGAIVRGDRVLHVGGADTSFLSPPD